MQKGKDSSLINVEYMQQLFFEELAAVNQDFREARKMLVTDHQTQLILYGFAAGPFKDGDIRIKAKYIFN